MPTLKLTVARFTPAERGAWLAAALPALSPQEQQRAAAMLDPEAGALHGVGRAMIRLIAADAAAADPAAADPNRLLVSVSELGKPSLPDLPDLHVSVSHTSGAVIAAVCDGTAVGVDAEPATPSIGDPRRLAERLFAETELRVLRELTDSAFADWFSSAWTIKEAVGKALGVGMVPAFKGAVLEGPADDLRLASVWSGPPADHWTVHQLRAPGGTEKIAVALPAPGIALGSVSQMTLDAFSRGLG